MEEDEEEEISGDVVWKMLIIQQVLNYNAVSAVFGMYLAAIKVIEEEESAETATADVLQTHSGLLHLRMSSRPSRAGFKRQNFGSRERPRHRRQQRARAAQGHCNELRLGSVNGKSATI